MEEAVSNEGHKLTEDRVLESLLQFEPIRKMIQCPVCLEIPIAPIYLCHSGHIVCNECRSKTKTCPLCKKHYSITRCFLAEGMIEKCVLPCRYADNGCQCWIRGNKLPEHLKNCHFRPVCCINCNGKLIDFKEYKSHLFSHHQISGIHDSQGFVLFGLDNTVRLFGPRCYFPQVYLKAYDATFLLCFFASSWCTCIWICLLGPEYDCSKFDAKLEYHPAGGGDYLDNDRGFHKWQGRVNNYREDIGKNIIPKNGCLLISKEILADTCPIGIGAEWLYSVAIYKRGNNNALKSETVETDDGAKAATRVFPMEGDELIFTHTTTGPTTVTNVSNGPDPGVVSSDGSVSSVLLSSNRGGNYALGSSSAMDPSLISQAHPSLTMELTLPIQQCSFAAHLRSFYVHKNGSEGYAPVACTCDDQNGSDNASVNDTTSTSDEE